MNNCLTLIGYVGQTPESKPFATSNNKLVKFSIGVKDFSNNEQKTLWIDVEAWNAVGERVLNTITKGREVVLNGRLAMSTYAKNVNGVAIQITKPVIKLTSFHLCGKKLTPQEESLPEQLRGHAPQ